jgi:hypothetical protein
MVAERQGISMGNKDSDLVVVHKVQGELVAHAIKSKLESQGIPVLLKYESAGPIYGITLNGLGEVKILVPGEFAEEAKQIIGT